MVAGGVYLSLAARADHVARAILVGTKERAAPLYPLPFPRLGGIEGRGRPLGVADRLAGPGQGFVVIRPVPVGAPLPDVAGHVVQAVAVRRVLRDGSNPGETVVPGVAALDGKLSL